MQLIDLLLQLNVCARFNLKIPPLFLDIKVVDQGTFDVTRCRIMTLNQI